jgi:hypothetical protein
VVRALEAKGVTVDDDGVRFWMAADPIGSLLVRLNRLSRTYGVPWSVF